MDKGLDTGDMLIKREIDIDENMILPELHDKLMTLGADALIETIDRLEAGTLTSNKQDDSFSNYAPMLNKDTGLIEIRHQFIVFIIQFNINGITVII